MGLRLAMGPQPRPPVHDDRGGLGRNNHDRGHLSPFSLSEKASDAPGQPDTLDGDPRETTTLCEKHPEIVRQREAKIDKSDKPGRSRP